MVLDRSLIEARHFSLLSPVSSLTELQLQDLSRILDKVFLLFPNYCLGMSFSQFYQNYELISFCTPNPIAEAFCKYYSEYQA